MSHLYSLIHLLQAWLTANEPRPKSEINLQEHSNNFWDMESNMKINLLNKFL